MYQGFVSVVAPKHHFMLLGSADKELRFYYLSRYCFAQKHECLSQDSQHFLCYFQTGLITVLKQMLGQNLFKTNNREGGHNTTTHTHTHGATVFSV